MPLGMITNTTTQRRAHYVDKTRVVTTTTTVALVRPPTGPPQSDRVSDKSGAPLSAALITDAIADMDHTFHLFDAEPVARNWDDPDADANAGQPGASVAVDVEWAKAMEGMHDVVLVGTFGAGAAFLKARTMTMKEYSVIGWLSASVPDWSLSEISADERPLKKLTWQVGAVRLSATQRLVLLSCDVDVPLTCCRSFAHALLTGLRSQHQSVVVFHSIHEADFYHDGNHSDTNAGKYACLRQLATSTSTLRVCPTLAAPNLLEGLSAALMTHCHFNATACTAIVLVRSVTQVGSDMLKDFECALTAAVPGPFACPLALSCYDGAIRNLYGGRSHLLYT